MLDLGRRNQRIGMFTSCSLVLCEQICGAASDEVVFFSTTQRRIKIDSWIDIGGGTLTFYQEQGKETSVINIPSVCIEKIDRDVQNGLVYIYTKSSLRADGTSLFVFEPFPVVRSLRFV